MIYLVFDHPHFQLYHFIIRKDSGFLKFLLPRRYTLVAHSASRRVCVCVAPCDAAFSRATVGMSLSYIFVIVNNSG